MRKLSFGLSVAFACGRLCCFGQTYTIQTVAGNSIGGYSNDNVPATSSELWGPHGIAADAQGNIYIADVNNCRIRKITPAGIISTIAGDGTPNYSGDGGPAVDAEVNFPRAVAVDAAGNVYIADTNNGVVREIATDGTINTIAGNGTRGYSGDGGQAIDAELFSPLGVGIDGSGNLFILDEADQVVRKVTPQGIISTYAGTGKPGFFGDGQLAVNALLNFPVSLAVDNAGNVYIGDGGNARVRMVGLNGIINTVAGNGMLGSIGDGGSATNAEIDDPQGLVVDAAGNLYIGDEDNQRVRMISNGIINTIAGTGKIGFLGDGGPASQAEFDLPQGLAFSSSGGILYVVDAGNNRVRSLTQIGLPSIKSGGVVSASDFGQLTSLAPGSWIEIYGTNLAADSLQWAGEDFSGSTAPTALDGTKVMIGGAAAFLDYVSPAQIDAQVPSTAGTGQQQIVVSTPSGMSTPYDVTIATSAPGLLAPASFKLGGIQYVAALYTDGTTYVLPSGAIAGVSSRPAQPGDTITLYGVGFGAVTPAVLAGTITPQQNNVAASFSISIGGKSAQVTYDGLAPQAIGLYQFDVVIPALTGSGAMPLTFSLGGTGGSQTLYIAVQGN